jgi:hypothetical protein
VKSVRRDLNCTGMLPLDAREEQCIEPKADTMETGITEEDGECMSLYQEANLSPEENISRRNAL